jgi:hypothetical protein
MATFYTTSKFPAEGAMWIGTGFSGGLQGIGEGFKYQNVAGGERCPVEQDADFRAKRPERSVK